VIAAKFLQGIVHIFGLVQAVGILQLRFLLGDRLFEKRDHSLALSEPLPAHLVQESGRIGLVHRQVAPDPAVLDRQFVQSIEQTGKCAIDISTDRNSFQEQAAQAR
jgi:hypothetical protein